MNSTFTETTKKELKGVKLKLIPLCQNKDNTKGSDDSHVHVLSFPHDMHVKFNYNVGLILGLKAHIGPNVARSGPIITNAYTLLSWKSIDRKTKSILFFFSVVDRKMGHTGEFFRRRDEWRKHPMLTSNLRNATPGLGIALVAFGIYCVGEQVYYKFIAPSPSHHQHQPAHASSSSSHWSAISGCFLPPWVNCCSVCAIRVFIGFCQS